MLQSSLLSWRQGHRPAPSVKETELKARSLVLPRAGFAALRPLLALQSLHRVRHMPAHTCAHVCVTECLYAYLNDKDAWVASVY